MHSTIAKTADKRGSARVTAPVALLAALIALSFASGGATAYLLRGSISSLLRPAQQRPLGLSPLIGQSLPSIPQWTLDGGSWAGPAPGRRTVLVFWSSDCGSCLREISELEGELVRLGLSADLVGLPLQPDVDLAACVAQRKGLSWPQLRGDLKSGLNPLARRLGVRSIPSLWLIDGEGKIRAANLARIEDLKREFASIAALP